MTTTVDIVNRALQNIGTRTNVTSAELTNQTSNEAIQANLVLTPLRDELLRMAPWDCAIKTANLTYITSTPGTPENTSAATNLWVPGQPAPPWAYEYQYPVDCLRACWMIPSTQTGYSGVPITTAVTGGAPSFWMGAPIKYKVQTDQFYPVTAAAVVAPGTGYVVGDLITLAQSAQGTAPLGAPVVLRVATLAGSGVATVTVVNQILGSATPQGGSYFAVQSTTQAQGSTTGVGTGATFTLTQGAQGVQRVILTNQEFAILAYVQQVTDPNVMDSLFIDAWSAILGSRLVMALTGDKAIANQQIQLANSLIAEARKVDANEGLTINDVTPDFIRVRGVAYSQWYSGPYSQMDWGPMFSIF